MCTATSNEYEQYMGFNIAESYIWTVEYFSKYLSGLGVIDPKITDMDVEQVRLCYDQSPSNRYYHGPEHAAFMGQPEVPPALAALLSNRISIIQAQSILVFAGLFHDAAYKHVDAVDQKGTRGWPTALANQIRDIAGYTTTIEEGRTLFKTMLTKKGRINTAAQLVAELFNVGGEGITHKQGGNEFDSALLAATFLARRNVPLRSLIAVITVIAATIPFKPALTLNEQNEMTDGHMGELAQRVKRLLEKTHSSRPELVWKDTNDIMLLSVHMANRDISAFIQPHNFTKVLHNGRLIKAEEIPELRLESLTIRYLARTASLQGSAPLLCGWLSNKNSPVPAKNVPHIYIPREADGQLTTQQSYPSLNVYHQAVKHVERNSRLSNYYFTAHELGITLAAAIATHIGEPDAPVPGIVHAARWHPKAVVRDTSVLNEDEQLIYSELLHGKSQTKIDLGTPKVSPIAAILFGALGIKGTKRLSKIVQQIRQNYDGKDPFANPTIAAEFIDDVRTRIGEDNFRIIITELHRVARYFQDDSKRGKHGRAAALEVLGDGLIVY